jgi:hypothetical protein
VLKILPDIAVTPGFSHDTTMGFAIGAYASVSFRRVRKEAALMGATPCEILGFSAAHELGHLLLGSGSHSDRGIMRPSWRREDFGVSPQGAFKFTAEQAQSIRTEVGKRAQEQAAEPIPRITVRMHDYAGVSRDTLDRAEGEMARIFEVAGIATTWVDCPLTTSELPQYPACLQPADSPRFDMNIVPRFMATRYAMHETALGFTSFAREGEHNSVASVFYDRVRETAESTPMSSPRLLAHAMAHELGHLLLRTSGHTPGGIMRARWTPDDLRLASCGRLLFTAEQAQLIRAEVWARRAQQEDAASGLVATQK